MNTIVVTLAQVKARMSEGDYARLFQRNGEAEDGEQFAQTVLDDAIEQVTNRLRAAYEGDDLPVSLVTSREVARCVVAFTVANAAQFYPASGDDKAHPYVNARKFADDLLTRIANDLGVRPTPSVDRPGPRAQLANATTSTGASTSPYRSSADGETNGGF